ncbi:pentatricopeptide repeat-containing protein At3g22690-like [Rosa rugosa]|uniref:pentatricopeptide repeat-containing protein At3g22690-like n=1 Tax=Rosa rugosa TaxID=74645 RepID=UPI002B40CE97|nr:pentatricopeptide repeat-containing protein At3g22690-like [Rosa rugosa]
MKGFSSIMGLEEDVFIGHSLIHFYAECGDLDYAQKVFDEVLEINTVSWTSLICGYGRRNMPKETVSLFFKIVATGIKSNSVTMVCVISACAKLKDVALSERWSSGVVDQEFAADVAIAKWHFIPHLQNRTVSEQPKFVFPIPCFTPTLSI